MPVNAPVLTSIARSRGNAILSTTIIANALSLALIAAGLLISKHLPPGPFAHGPGFTDEIVSMDARIYQGIATNGYQWSANTGTQFGHGQNMALFPGFPLILAAIGRLITLSPLVVIVTSLATALLATSAFAHLAAKFLPSPKTRLATLLFATWPALCFNLMGYPTGLINLTAAICLINYIAGRRLTAAIWAGLGTAMSPTMVFIALAITFHNLSTGPNVRNLARKFALGILSIWGLLAFMLYQTIAFKNPLAFIDAQRGFASLPSFFPHLIRLLNPAWYLFPIMYSSQTITNLFHNAPTTPQIIQSILMATQLNIDLAAIILCILTLIRAAKTMPQKILPISGAVLLAGYLWFVATSSFQLLCAVRMLYPVFPIFLIIATTTRPAVIYATITLFSLLSIAAVAVIAAGYGII